MPGLFDWQADPLAALTRAFAHLAEGIAGIGLDLPIGGFTNRQVCLAVAVLAGGQDVNPLMGHETPARQISGFIP